MQNSQHKRSLANGILLSAIAPVVFAILLVFIIGDITEDFILVACYISFFGLLVSIPSALFGALPFFILLRHRSILSGPIVFLGCTIIGSVVTIGVEFILFRELSFHSIPKPFSLNVFMLMTGAGFGAVAGLALTWGAGVPFKPVSRDIAART